MAPDMSAGAGTCVQNSWFFPGEVIAKVHCT